MKTSLRALALTTLLAGVVVSLSVPADAQVSIQLRLGTRERPLQGRQFETMRALAHYLDEAAQDASTAAVDNVRGHSRSTRQFLASLNNFSQRASAFHERMDTYTTNPWDVPDEVASLDLSARRVNDTIRRTYVFADVADNWNNVVDAVNQMKQLLAGYDVRVPPAHGRRGDYERDYAPFGTGNVGGGHERDLNHQDGTNDYHSTPDSGYHSSPYDSHGSAWAPQFRELVHQLDVHVTRAHELAERTTREDEGSQALFVTIHHLNDEVTALHQRADSGQLDRRELRPAIQHLLEDAQATDRRMRQTGVFRETWIEWKESISILLQLSDMLG
jgi:hypothetical protein